MPHGAKLVSCCWVFKLKYRDGAYERHRSCIVAIGYQHDKGHDYFESFPPTCSHLQSYYSACPSTQLDQFPDGILWILTPCVLSFQATLPKQVYVQNPSVYDIADGNCLSMLKCIYGLVQAPRQYCTLCHEIDQKAGMKQF